MHVTVFDDDGRRSVINTPSPARVHHAQLGDVLIYEYDGEEQHLIYPLVATMARSGMFGLTPVSEGAGPPDPTVPI